MKDIFEKYLRSLSQDRSDKTEHSDRSAFETVLKAAAEQAGPGIRVIHEAKKVPGKGGPDFKVMKTAMILGYVEVKQLGENLDQVLKSDQIARYKQLSKNILVTDYLQFVWLKDGRVNARDSIAFPHDLEDEPREDRVKAVSDLLRGFFSTAPEGIGRAEQLALALATRSHFLRDYLDKELRRQEKEHAEGRLYGLFQIFRDQVFHELTLAEFADAFAQMLAYGLFLARLNSDSHDVTLQNARQYVPGSFRLIRELVDFLSELERDEYQNVRWVVEEVLSIVNGLDLIAIHEDLSFKHRKAVNRKVRAKDEEEHRLFERDPFIYFYEDFLAKYDAKMKKSRGVYYTPPPIVNFIVRAIDDILKDTFGIKDGLADNKRVTVLDFACGTGTFLLEVFQRVFDNIGGSDAGRAGPIVREHLLRNIFGFEYLIAPYTIAHLKLSQYLSEQGHALTGNERLQIFLTNTLEPIEPQKHLLLPAVTAEVEAAQKVKDREILVITGNPPYSGHSKNKGAWITAKINAYKLVDGKPLGEKNPKWLQDDYVKFIRFAQMKMDAVEEGIVGVITNHSWLDNPTFRGMRQSLERTFDQIWIVDLHGSTKPKELAPADAQNENVFDIQKGVAITLLVKKPGAPKSIRFSELWGSRIQKYKAAAEAEINDLPWKDVPYFKPYYLFRPLDWTGWESYKSGWSIADSLSPAGQKAQIFDLNVLGFQSHRDHFAVAFQRSEIETRSKDMIDITLSDSQLAKKYRLKNNRDWKLCDARKELRGNEHWQRSVMQCAYRPFDSPYCFYGPEFMDYPRRELLDHVSHRNNISLVVSRQIGTAHWRHAFIASEPANDCLISDESREANQVFPLWRFDDPDVRHENLSTAFRAFIDACYEHPYTPEEILGCIYAVLHAPTYRARYAEFLRIDFPRIPFPEKAADFEALSLLGWALIQVHLLLVLPRTQLAEYHGKRDDTVEAVGYSPEEQTVSINKSQSFKPVPNNVWDFRIGGYQVIDKYLKSRKGRKLTLDEINHVSAIADSLAFTIAQMTKIDAAYRAAFPDRG
jgi:predicted helicase